MKKHDSYSAFYFMSAIRLTLCLSWIASGVLFLMLILTGWFEENVLGFQMGLLNFAGMGTITILISGMGMAILGDNIKTIREEYKSLKQYFN